MEIGERDNYGVKFADQKNPPLEAEAESEKIQIGILLSLGHTFCLYLFNCNGNNLIFYIGALRVATPQKANATLSPPCFKFVQVLSLWEGIRDYVIKLIKIFFYCTFIDQIYVVQNKFSKIKCTQICKMF